MDAPPANLRALPVCGKVTILASELEKPDLDNRAYRVIRLSNKLEALLVHDPDTDKASAAMDVHVGSFSDREDLQVSWDLMSRYCMICGNT